MKSHNTPQNGTVRVIVFKEKSQWVGAALDFNIVETGDDPREVMLMLDEAIRGYVTSAKKAKLGNEVLNQTADKEYEDLWKNLEAQKPIPSFIKVYNHGRQSLSFA